MSFKLYDILGVQRSTTSEEIKQVYRKRAVSEHPDKGGDPEKFKQLTAAYSILSDSQEKAKYDQFGDNGEGQRNSFDINTIFSRVFNVGKGFSFQQPKRDDYFYQLDITQKDAFFGLSKNIKINLKKVCFQCMSRCPMCNGTGQITETLQISFFTQIQQKKCPGCEGRKQVLSVQNILCKNCYGSGEIVESENICINVPAGADNDHRISFCGFGEQKKILDEINGDFVVIVKINPDPLFLRRGNNLVYRSGINFIESIIGKKIIVPYYSQDSIEIDIEKFTVIRPDKEYIIPGKGMPVIGHSGVFGNMILVFDIDYSVSPEMKLELKNKFKSI